jgi:hypothetical protein
MKWDCSWSDPQHSHRCQGPVLHRGARLCSEERRVGHGGATWTTAQTERRHATRPTAQTYRRRREGAEIWRRRPRVIATALHADRLRSGNCALGKEITVLRSEHCHSQWGMNTHITLTVPTVTIQTGKSSLTRTANCLHQPHTLTEQAGKQGSVKHTRGDPKITGTDLLHMRAF